MHATRDTYEQVENAGYAVLNEGAAEGVLVGGCLCDLTMLQGTEYMPSLANTILFLEEDSSTTPRVFDRALQSLLLQPSFSGVRGIILGRFQKKSSMT